MARKKWLLAGIDVGTTKICSTVARAEQNGIRVLGTGLSPSQGLKRGVVANLSETIESIKASLERTEKQSQTVVESAYVSIGGTHLWSANSSGKTEVRSKDREITAEDIERAITAAQSVKVPVHWKVTHVLTQNFSVDGQNGIVNPLGMSGHELQVNLHMVLHASAVVQNIVNAVNKAGVLVEGVVMQQLASAMAVLNEDERELGAVVVDIGGGTSDINVYRQGSVYHTEVLPMGGNLITRDIAIGLKVPIQEAEQIKKEMACVSPDSVAAEEVIEVSEVGTGRRHTVSRRMLCQIVQARCDEMLKAVAEITDRAGVRSELATGIVMTGGGSLLEGLVDRAEQIFEMPVRVGYPINLVSPEEAVFHPAYCTAFGLLQYAQEVQRGELTAVVREKKAREQRGVRWMKNWVLEKIM